MKSFYDIHNYNLVRTGEENIKFKKFLYCVYLTLEHELVARNTMIWEMYRYCNCSKEMLYELFEDSFIYESFEFLDSFNINVVIHENNILKKVNKFISYFKGDKMCNNQRDVILFFTNWDKYFKERCKLIDS